MSGMAINRYNTATPVITHAGEMPASAPRDEVNSTVDVGLVNALRSTVDRQDRLLALKDRQIEELREEVRYLSGLRYGEGEGPRVRLRNPMWRVEERDDLEE
jgi:hypothetical protein